jgi:hypothetical protein
MSSSDFKLKLAYDSVLNDVSSSINYSVKKGPADRTFQSFNANSASSSSINFTINPPSESTVVDRDVIITSKINFQIKIGDSQASPANVPPGESIWNYGLSESLQSFPLNRLMTNSTLSCNNVSISVNNSDVLPGLLRCLPKEFMQKYYGLTSTYLDNYAYLPDCPGRSNNPLADYGGAGYNDFLLPRGVQNISYIIPDGAGNLAGINRYDATGLRIDDSPVSTAVTDYWIIGLQVKIAEPLFISPLLFGDPKFNHAGMLGINNLQLVLSVDSQMKRFFSSANSSVESGRYNLSFKASNPFEDMQLQLTFLTAPLPMVLPPKSVLPFMSYVPYVTQTSSSIAQGASDTLNINSLQLEVIPDKFIVYVRQKLADQSVRSADSFLEIEKVSITFANQSGLLSNASQYQLYKLSHKNGCEQDWFNWRGRANKYLSVPPYNATYPLTGSVLVIDPSMDLGVGAPSLASGSIGQYTFQMQLTVRRNVPDHPDKVGFVPEVCVVACRSGIVVTSSGTSTLTTNMLNAQLVTETIEKDKNPGGSDEYDRLMGGMARSGGVARSGGARSGGKYSKMSSLLM